MLNPAEGNSVNDVVLNPAEDNSVNDFVLNPAEGNSVNGVVLNPEESSNVELRNWLNNTSISDEDDFKESSRRKLFTNQKVKNKYFILLRFSLSNNNFIIFSIQKGA